MRDITNTTPITAEYMPTHGYAGYFAYHQNRPPFNPYLHVPQMMADPDIIFGMLMKKGPILSRGRFFIKCEETRVKQYLIDQITRFWRTSAAEALKAMEWGWSGSEVMYRDEEGLERFDYLKGLQSQDVRPRVTEGQLSSVVVRNNKGGQVRLGGMKAFWFVHGREFHNWWGRSDLFGAYPDWLEQWTPDGAREQRRLFFHKYNFDDGIWRYPHGQTFPLSDGTNITAKDLLRDAVEKKKAGGSLFLPWAPPDSAQFLHEPGTVQPPPEGIMEWLRDLRDGKWTGMGVPPEVARAADTGSGYAGRRVPLLGFYAGLQQIVNALISDADKQIFKPLTQRNFGYMKYEIVPLPLMETDEKEGEQPQEGVEQDAQFSEVVKIHGNQLATNGTCYWAA